MPSRAAPRMTGETPVFEGVSRSCFFLKNPVETAFLRSFAHTLKFSPASSARRIKDSCHLLRVQKECFAEFASCVRLQNTNGTDCMIIFPFYEKGC
jgi:hypothetical protein